MSGKRYAVNYLGIYQQYRSGLLVRIYRINNDNMCGLIFYYFTGKIFRSG